ncbi:Crp/Fnr family transcriptional regulator [Paludibacterium yongneupense]|uniref:Crp/Fnr family transcriptional regulator n=1 Tax=Paludibacterium yongneupense TaxID=400061 RepID=UPI0004232025|nr:Crp/Fnr family transcriptional regulator [Paludibacterium yongneupense]
MSKVDIPAFLRHQPMFQELAPPQIEALAPHTREVRGEKGQIVFQKGDPCAGMFLVVYGRVKLSLFSAQGTEKVVEVIEPGQSFAEAVMFLGYPYPLTAQFLEDGLLLQVGAEAIFRALDEEPGFARRLLAGMSLRLHGLVRDVERYSIESSMQRVCGYLLQAQAGQDGDAAALTLPLSKSLIASRLNLTPETFSRVLQRLSAAGLIRVDGREVAVLNSAGLLEFSR